MKKINKKIKMKKLKMKKLKIKKMKIKKIKNKTSCDMPHNFVCLKHVYEHAYVLLHFQY